MRFEPLSKYVCGRIDVDRRSFELWMVRMSRTGEMKSPKSVCVVYTEKNGCVSMPKRCGGEVVVCLRHGEKCGAFAVR